jgi:hypothetical protein
MLKAKRQHQSVNGGHSQCELAHIAAAICIVHADGWEMRSKSRGLNEKFAGNNCSTLRVEYRPSSRHIRSSP